jgi:hypothetical protein
MSKSDVSKQEEKKFSTVPLDWKEVYYTNCPLVAPSNIDQELGWTKESSRRSVSSTLFSARCAKMTTILTTSTTSTTSSASAVYSPHPRSRRHPQDQVPWVDTRI